MKYILIALVLVVSASAFSTITTAPKDSLETVSIESSIKWHSGTKLSEIMSLSESSDKLIYVDVSTTWCGYCKKMKRETYTNESVASYLNDNYIAMKVDAEKGEGSTIARKYGVSGYPTQLILDSNGKLIKKHAGYMKVSGLQKFINK